MSYATISLNDMKVNVDYEWCHLQEEDEDDRRLTEDDARLIALSNMDHRNQTRHGQFSNVYAIFVPAIAISLPTYSISFYATLLNEQIEDALYQKAITKAPP